MYQFFVDDCQIGKEYVTVTGSDVNHIKNVLRMRPGEKIRVSSSSRDMFCEIAELTDEFVQADILDEEAPDTELPSQIYLFQGLPKGDRMEYIIQKSVELGVHEIIPVAMKYCVVKLDAKKAGNTEAGTEGTSEDSISAEITRGLGGSANIEDVDCCATRLRCTVSNADLVNDGILKATGASGVVHRGQGVQIIYGPGVTVIKANLEDYLEHAPKELYEPQKDAESTGQNISEDDKIETKAEEKKIVDTIVISSPITGVAADLSTTPDEAFAGRMMGDGAVVTPEDAIVKAPEDGEVCFVFDTKHAIGFMTESGVSLLIHVGIDTVKLDGKGFECFVENGQTVKKGDPMLKLDLDYLKANAPSVASPVLCTELEDNQKIRLLNEGEIKAGDELFAIDIYEA